MHVIIVNAFQTSNAGSQDKLFITCDRDNLSNCAQPVTVTAYGDSVSGFGVYCVKGTMHFTRSWLFLYRL